MGKKKQKNNDKTNVMRILDQHHLVYEHYQVSPTTDLADITNGVTMARLMNQNPDHVFKTLVTIGKSKQHYVFMIPVAAELDLKKAATAVGEKSIAMIKAKELEPLTGYVHGGCSPIGMKKIFETVIDETAELYDTIIFSAGKVGYQVEMSLDTLKQVVPVKMNNLTFEQL
ncbi:aminoacyl-tRNA deacylase [Atopobacter phocae]|uniref:aminoacyl-tRNA deacylase n=1 Tax=Atopobacter phocae TaxID=136492 RepID=UPI000472D2EB|nr:aminoacyl-tRNA deacylase [Atopobacter phocae]